MSEFCHPPRGRDEYGTLLTSGRRTRCTPAETEKLSRDGRARSAGLRNWMAQADADDTAGTSANFDTTA